MRKAYKVLVGKSERKRPFGRPRRRWEYIRMYHRKRGWGAVYWIHMAQHKGPMEGPHEHGNAPSGLIKGGYFLDCIIDY
jgi:hypothetical protein